MLNIHRNSIDVYKRQVQNLLAYVILKDGVRDQFERDIDITKAIKADLEDIMMSYMMPTKFLYRESLPLKMCIRDRLLSVPKNFLEQNLPTCNLTQVVKPMLLFTCL